MWISNFAIDKPVVTVVLMLALSVFGVTGMVLGPVILAVTLALIDMWRRRAM